MLRYRTQGFLAVGLGLLAGGCFGDPELNTDLRPAGAPEVLAAMSVSNIDHVESPFTCRYVGSALDPKAPNIVAGSVLCPTDEADFSAASVDPRTCTTANCGDDAISWGIRVMFDELLDGDAVEALDCDAATGLCSGSLKPGVGRLTCGGAEGTTTEVGFTGWYAPNGNNVTLPVGPSIKVDVNPDEMTFATGTKCVFTIGDVVVDKGGNTVPMEQRKLSFELAALDVTTIDVGLNGAAETNQSGTAPVGFVFNASLDAENETSLDDADFEIVDSNDAVVAGTSVAGVDDYNYDIDPDAVEVGDLVVVAPATYWLPGAYTARLKTGAAIEEIHGGTLTATADTLSGDFTVAFGAQAALSTRSGMLPAANNLTIRFNGPIDPATVTLSGAMAEIQLKDAANADVPFTATIGTGNAADTITIDPTANLTAGMMYRLIVPAGSTIGYAGTTCAADAAPQCKTATFAAARTVTVTAM